MPVLLNAVSVIAVATKSFFCRLFSECRRIEVKSKTQRGRNDTKLVLSARGSLSSARLHSLDACHRSQVFFMPWGGVVVCGGKIVCKEGPVRESVCE